MSQPKLGLVVLVEDDPDVRETLSEVLEEEHFVVRSYGDGPRALAELQAMSELPALLLLDLKMPHMDGFAFRAEQEETGALGQIPTVILSADSNVEANMHKLRVQGYLRKPVHIQALLELVGKFVRPSA